jgi:hypothetical protein
MELTLKYTIEVVREEHKLPVVRVIEKFEDHWEANTFDDLHDKYNLFQDMNNWCEDNSCGYRSSYNEFKFRTEEQLLMFVMRWSQ